jgi:hypothetical protein
VTSSLEGIVAGLATSREALSGALSSLAVAREELAEAARILAETLPKRDLERLGTRLLASGERVERVEERLRVADAAVDAFARNL